MLHIMNNETMNGIQIKKKKTLFNKEKHVIINAVKETFMLHLWKEYQVSALSNSHSTL